MSIFTKDLEKSDGVKYIKEKYGCDPKPVEQTGDMECLFSIYDKICQEYNPPFVSKNLQVAIRSMRDSLKGQQTLVSMHPEDYSLVCIGYYDKFTGLIIPCNISSDNHYPLVKILEKKEGIDG